MQFIFGCLAVIALTVAVSAQSDSAAKDGGGTGVGHGLSQGNGHMGMGQMMSMPDEMKQRCQMMMQTVINPSDPAAILSLRDDLKLTAEQVQKMQSIAEKARQDAKAVLDQQQARKLQAVPAKPETPMAMHQHMMQIMQQMHANRSGNGQKPMMNCPMMNMMMGGDKSGASTTRPAQDKPQDDAGSSHEAHH